MFCFFTKFQNKTDMSKSKKKLYKTKKNKFQKNKNKNVKIQTLKQKHLSTFGPLVYSSGVDEPALASL